VSPFVFFGPDSTGELHFSPITRHKQVMRHDSLTQRGH